MTAKTEPVPPTTYARPDLLVDTVWLAEHLADPDLRLFDCTTILTPDANGTLQATSGRADFERGHIPGARFIDLQQDLSDAQSRLRFTLPGASHFAAAMRRLGVSDDARVVLYSTGGCSWATRVWWMLAVFGFDRAAVLDGGFAKWAAEGRAVEGGPAPAPAAAGVFNARFRGQMVVGAREVQAAIDDPAQTVVNALAAEQFKGTSPVSYGRRGRIRNSISIPASSLLKPSTQALLPAAELAAKLGSRVTAGAGRVITYCGGGIAATVDAFALALLGVDNVAVYDASLQEWAADPALPMEQG